MKLALFLPLVALAEPILAQEAGEPVTPGSVVEAASADEWVPIAPDDLLVMELAPDAAGNPRQVVIQLLPPPFSQPWVENIRTLAAAHWWDGTSVYRVVDNWVTQWGDVSEEKPLPEGVVSPDDEYAIYNSGVVATNAEASWAYGDSRDNPQFIDGHILLNSPATDTYGSFYRGWPIAGKIRPHDSVNWPIHCYAHVGVARNTDDTGTGSELYAVIGHAPRQLDRNIAVVGRVIEGIAHLSTLPRGTGDAGVYETRAEDTPIISVRLASEMADPPAFEYLDTASESFARYVEVRANRNDAFYTVPAGGVDVCNVQVPIREVAQ